MQINNPMFSTIENEIVTEKATFKGVTRKTGMLLAITLLSGLAIMLTGTYNNVLLIAASIIGIIAVVMGRMNPNKAMIAGVVYSICEGIMLGSISGLIGIIPGFEAAVPIAIVATLSIFITMLVLYSMKIVAATPTLQKVMYAAGSAIILFMLISFVLSLFGSTAISEMFYSNTPMAALLAILFIAYGSFMLVLNFNEAQTYVDNGFDRKYEWVAALGLIITILYIYIQVLRFVLIILSRRD